MFKRILTVFMAAVFTLSVWVMPATAAEEDFHWNTFDKAYVTFMFDDGRMPFTRDCYQIFANYGLPMSCAVIAKYTDPASGSYNPELVDALHDIQDFGGEILSHGYGHIPVTSEERAKNPQQNSAGAAVYTEEDIDYEFRKSYQVLTKNGFKVGGIIQVGAGGDEGTADYNLVDKISRRYYKYSDAYGAATSIQYKKGRSFLTTFVQTKNAIDKAIANKQWIIIAAHEFGNSSGNIDSEALRSTLDYVIANNVEVVTWAQMYEKFGNYSGPEIPSVKLDLAPYKTNTPAKDESSKVSTVTSSKVSITSSANTGKDTSSKNSSPSVTTVSSQPSAVVSDESQISSTEKQTSVDSSATSLPAESTNTTNKENTSSGEQEDPYKTIKIIAFSILGLAGAGLITVVIIFIVISIKKHKKAAVKEDMESSND